MPQDCGEALLWYLRAAEQGYAGAQSMLGTMYSTGEGIPQDYAQAVQWYLRAAEQGYAAAQFNLGFMYDKGQGVPQNNALAVQWYRRAAEQGDARAQNNLGYMYDNGQGVPQDSVQAHVWYNLAAARIEGPYRERAVRNRDLVAAKMTPAQLARAQEMARTWQPRPEYPAPSVKPSPGATTTPQLVQPTPATQREEIPLKGEGGVYTLPAQINGVLTLHFVLDTGAAEVNIPADVALTLLRTGTIRDPDDFLPGATYTLADGTTVKSFRFVIRSLKIGRRLLTNVPASIGEIASPLLLGQSFLKRLGTWSMDSQRQVLVLGSPLIRNEPLPTKENGAPSTSRAVQKSLEKIPAPSVPQERSASQPLPPALLPQQRDIATGQTYVRQMISGAMTEGGVSNEEAILVTKRRIEALKLKRLADPPVRKRARVDNERGLQYISNGQIPEAAQAFQAAYQGDPTDVEIINNLGDAYMRLNDLQAAESLLFLALVFAPGRANAWANLGATYAKQGQRNAAVACLANAYRFSRNQEGTRQFLQTWAEGEDTEVREAAHQTLQLPLVQARKP